MEYSETMDWASEVSEIRSMLDPAYLPTSSVPGSHIIMGWGKIGVDKFCDRVIPVLTNAGPKTLQARGAFNMAKHDSTAFGNSTIILNSDGSYRTVMPENGHAFMDAFGHVIFNEAVGTVRLRAKDGIVEISNDEGKTWKPTDSIAYTFFHGLDTGHSRGQSRITKSTRYFIKEATKTYQDMREAQKFHATPQVVLNKVYAQLMPALPEIINRIKAGAKRAIVIPEGPDGQEVKIETIPAGDLTQYEKVISMYAGEVAANFNIEVAELGKLHSGNAASAESQYMAKEDLIIEIRAYETAIKATAEAFFKMVALLNDEPEPELSFAPPATPSPQSAADFITKMAATFPAIKYSRAAMNMAFLPEEVINDLMDEGIRELAKEEDDEQLP